MAFIFLFFIAFKLPSFCSKIASMDSSYCSYWQHNMHIVKHWTVLSDADVPLKSFCSRRWIIWQSRGVRTAARVWNFVDKNYIVSCTSSINTVILPVLFFFFKVKATWDFMVLNCCLVIVHLKVLVAHFANGNFICLFCWKTVG